MSRSSDGRFGPAGQRGDILVESLIGVVLMSIIGLGMIAVTARVEVSHRYSNAQGLAVGQMRNLLQQYGNQLCSDSSLAVISLPPNDRTVDLQVACATPAISVNGVALESPPDSVTLSTPSEASDYFGGVVKVGEN
jgi:hypothetical protein